MIIQHNLSATNAARQLRINNTGASKNLEKLSSGFKINRAGDDAAGLAISEKMRGQIRGLAMAETNAVNGINLIQTAEGGTNEIHSILQRIRELAVQSSNGTFSDQVDREGIDKEIKSLKDEINRISSSTHYNGINLLNGSLGGEDTSGRLSLFDADYRALGFNSSPLRFWLDEVNGVELEGQEAKIVTSKADNNSESTMTLQIGDKSYKQKLGAASFVDEDGNVIAHLSSSPTPSNTTKSGVLVIKEAKFSDSVLGLTSINCINYTGAGNRIATEDSKIFFQIGANGTADQRVGLHVDNMSVGHLGSTKWDPEAIGVLDGFKVIDVDASTREKANASIIILDDAINQVSGTRSDLGALQNRLEHTLNNLGVARENLTAAESSIRDVDMAKEMMAFTKNNILSQSAQAMLAQANQLPQGILSLLR